MRDKKNEGTYRGGEGTTPVTRSESDVEKKKVYPGMINIPYTMLIRRQSTEEESAEPFSL